MTTFCMHNEEDLEADIESSDGTDWVVIRCNACSRRIGVRHRLIDMIDRAVRARREQAEREARNVE